MKQILSIIFFAQLFLWANPQFSSQEQSVFESNAPILKQEKSAQEQADNLNDNSSEDETTNKNRSIEILNALINNHPDENDDSAIPFDSGDDVVAEFEEMDPVDYFTPIEFNNGSRSKSLYLSYLHYPKKIYKNQRFEVVIKALVTTDDFNKVETRFINAKNMTVLNPEKEWLLKDNNTFENTYYFKAYEENFVMPTFQVLLYKEKDIVEVQTIKPEEMSFTEIGKEDENFSSVIAKNITINAYKTKQYNNNELITILDIQAQESNLEDFKLRYVEEQGFSKIIDDYPEQSIIYYLVLPVHKKKITFTYYNTQTKGFKKIVIPVELENELVSTQTDLNPNNSNMLFYKKVAFSVLSVLCLIMFAWKRKYIYLIALLICMIFLIMYMMPNKQAYVKAETTIYILPTNNSTIFYKTSKATIVQVAMKRENFVKIIMNDNNQKIIGWIKEEQLVEN